MAAWCGWRKEENACENRQEKREAEDMDKVEVTSGVTIGSLRRFRAALTGPTQGLSKRRQLRQSLRTLTVPWSCTVDVMPLYENAS